jgi:hypothetical protein
MRKVLVLLFSVLLNSAHAFDIDLDEVVDGYLSDCEDLNKAWELYDKKQYSRAILLFNCNGTPEANSALGYMYEHGEGVSVDYKKASEFYYLAADAGRRDAQNNLGSFYENGRLGKPDYDKAFKYYLLSSKQGYALAKRNLGRLYVNGKGTPRDVKKAISLWKEASAEGNNSSTYLLAQVYSTNDFGVKNLNSAKEWATRALKNGMPQAKDLLAKVNAELQVENVKKKETKLVSSKNYVPRNSWCPVGSPVDGFKDFKFGMSKKEKEEIKRDKTPLLGEERYIYTAFSGDCLDKIWIELHDITQKQNLELRKLLPKRYGLSFAPSKIDFDKYNAITRNSDRSQSNGDGWFTEEGREYKNQDNNLIWGYADGQVLFMLRKEWVADLRCMSYFEGCKSRVSGYLFYLNNKRAKEVLNEGLKRTRIRNKKTTINDL